MLHIRPVGRVLTTKQLLDEVEHDIMKYQNRGLFYLPKPKAEVLIIHDIMRKPNSMIVLLYSFLIIHPQKQKQSVCFWGEHSKGLSNQVDVELDMINVISAILHLSCQVHKLLWIDWMLSTNQIFHSESDV